MALRRVTMRMLALVFLLAASSLATALLRHSGPVRRNRVAALRLEKGSGSGDDFDSSGMTAMSSNEIKEVKMKQQLEAEKKEAERIGAMLKKSADLNSRVKDESLQKKAAPAPPAPAPAPVSAPVPAAVSFPTSSPAAAGAEDDADKQLANFSAGSSAFDFGLLIAFPVIIGTLALFFVFPFVGEKLAGGSGPLPPSM